ncbi:C40 family peptidase [bacterium]|nr:C40 family peptidase [bacterium]
MRFPLLQPPPPVSAEEPPPLPQVVTLRGNFSDVYQQVETAAFAGLGPASVGPKVSRLQKILARWNPRLGVEVNGVFDLKTERAISLYQAIYSKSGGAVISGEVSQHLVRMSDGSFWNHPPTKTPGQQLLYQAAQQLGVPYRLGGDGVSSTDCGRLVQQSTAKLAPELSRCADEQYRSAQKGLHGLSVVREPQAGDLVFFRYPSSQSGEAYAGVTHVGLRVDSNWMLAASAGAGKVVVQKSAPLRPYLLATAGFRS